MPDDDIAKMLAEVSEDAEREDLNEAAGLKRVRYVRSKGPRPPSPVYSIRMPTHRIAEIRDLAERRGEAPTAMLREFVLERLDDEREAPVLRIRLAGPIFEEAKVAAVATGLTMDEFVSQAVVLLTGRCNPRSAKKRHRA